MSRTTLTDLEEMCSKLDIPLKFIGYKDELPSTPRQGAYIVNLASEPDDNLGTHWLSVWIGKKNKYFFFDSYGVEPPAEILSLIGDKYTTNTNQIQSLKSGYCGWYCVAFLYCMSRGLSYNEFLSIFDKDISKNLKLLKAFIKKIIK